MRDLNKFITYNTEQLYYFLKTKRRLLNVTNKSEGIQLSIYEFIKNEKKICLRRADILKL